MYRKYRPMSFTEVVGQEHVVKTLQGGLTSGRIGHAYLFCGPRGSGKTTIARIFAKALNCEKRKADGSPCNACGFCNSINIGNSLDLVEIDAASQTGVDNIRELTDSAHVAAPGGGYKIFLIDEVHMLSKSAFNALLKILEEPPTHVMFILATTEPHKILPTVLSRVQRFDFRKLTPPEILGKLKSIAQKEKISIADEGLEQIARSSDGALRDAEVSLTKVISFSNGKRIGESDVNTILGLIPSNYFPQFLTYLTSANKSEALAFIENIHNSGIDLENFAKDFLRYARNVLVSKVSNNGVQLAGHDSVDPKQLVKIIQLFTHARTQIKSSPIPQLPLELAVLELLE